MPTANKITNLLVVVAGLATMALLSSLLVSQLAGYDQIAAHEHNNLSAAGDFPITVSPDQTVDTDLNGITYTISRGSTTGTIKLEDNRNTITTGLTYEYLFIDANSSIGCYLGFTGDYNEVDDDPHYLWDSTASSPYTAGDDLTIPAARAGDFVCFLIRGRDKTLDDYYYYTIKYSIPHGDLVVDDGALDNTYKAVDGSDAPSTWLYTFILNNTDQCNSSLDFTDSGVHVYREGSDVGYSGANNADRVCFRVQYADGNYYYAASRTILLSADLDFISISDGASSNSFKAVNDTDNINDTSWQSVFIDGDVACDASAFAGSAGATYTEGSDLPYTAAHNGLKACFSSTDDYDVVTYQASSVVSGPQIVAISVSRNLFGNYLYTSKTQVVVTITFDRPLASGGQASLLLNTIGGIPTLNRPFTAGSKTITFDYVPRNGETTPGIGTDDLDDDIALRAASLTSTIVGQDGLPIATDVASVPLSSLLPDDIDLNNTGLPKVEFVQYTVDARRPTVTVTNPNNTDLPTPTVTKVAAAVAGTGDTVSLALAWPTLPGTLAGNLPAHTIHRKVFDKPQTCDASQAITTVHAITDTILAVDDAAQLACFLITMTESGTTIYADSDGGTSTNLVAKTFSAVDDFDANLNNEFHEGYRTWGFEYYYVPASYVEDIDLVGELGKREADYRCKTNDFPQYEFLKKDRFAYTEGQDITVDTDQYNDHYICFRARRQDSRLYWVSSQLDFGGQLSDLVQGVTTKRIIRIDSSTANALPNPIFGEAVTISVHFSGESELDMTNGSPKLILNNGAEATFSSESFGVYTLPTGYDSIVFIYTVDHPSQRIEGLNVTSFDLNGATLTDATTNLPVGNNLADNHDINVIIPKPTITGVWVSGGANHSPYGQNGSLEIIVEISDELDDANQAAWNVDLELNTGERVKGTLSSTAISYDDVSRQFSFQYTVGNNKSANPLQVKSFSYQTGADDAKALQAPITGANLDKTLPLTNLDTDPNHGTVVEIDSRPLSITVTKGSQRHSLQATDNDNDLDANSWHVAIVTDGSACDDSSFTSPLLSYNLGTDLPLIEADNGKRACFRSVDPAGSDPTSGLDNVAYKLSKIIDTLPPLITLSAIDNYRVSAEVDDQDASVGYQLLAAGSTCGANLAATSFQAYDLQSDIIIDNDHLACFKAVDEADNPAYKASPVVSDHTAPLITIDGPDAQNFVSAKAKDDDGDGDDQTKLHDRRPVMRYVELAAGSSCDGSLASSMSAYQANRLLGLRQARLICFEAYDAVGNKSYKASEPGADIRAPRITIKNGSALHTLSAVDDEDDTVMHLVLDASDCDSDAVFFTTDNNGDPVLAAGVKLYQEATDISVSDSNRYICFRSKDAANNISYKGKDIFIDTTTPKIYEVAFYNPGDQVLQDTYYIGDSLQLRLRLTEGVLVDINAGSPLLNLNTGDKAYYNASASGSTRLVFDYTVVEGYQNTDDLNVDSIDLNGSIIQDSSLNQLDTNIDNLLFGNLADIYDIGVNGARPIITISSGSVANSYQVSTDVAVFGSVINYVFIDSDASCQASLFFVIDAQRDLFSFVYADLDTDIVYTDAEDGQVMCVRAVPNTAYRNLSYATSPVIGALADTVPPIVSVGNVVNNQVAATATDDSGSISSFRVQLINPGQNCDSSLSLSSFDAYQQTSPPVKIDLPASQRACFVAADSDDNLGYGVSTAGLAVNLPPAISIIGTGITNGISAEAYDINNNTYIDNFNYQIIGAGEPCGDSLSDASFSPYASHTLIILPFEKQACFKAVTSANRVGYAVSEAGVFIAPPTITSISATSPDGYYKAGDEIVIRVDFSEHMATDNSQQELLDYLVIGLNNGGTAKIDIANSSNDYLIFIYTALAGHDTVTDLDLTGFNTAVFGNGRSRITFYSNTTTIEFDNALPITNTLADNSDVHIDTMPPSIVTTLALVNDQHTVTASASDRGQALIDTASFQYQLINQVTGCNDQLDNFASYSAATAIALPLGQKVCFVVADRAGNTVYQASDVATVVGEPTISNITSDQADGSYSVDQQIIIKVHLSEAVTVSNGSPLLELNNGATASYDDSASSDQIQVFVYTVSSGDDVDDLTVSNYNLNGASVVAVDDSIPLNSALVSANLADNSDITIDTTGPAITVSQVVNNQVSALISDDSDLASFEVQTIASGVVCDDQLNGSGFSSYSAAQPISLAVGSKACFKALDDLGNSSYAASTSGLTRPVSDTTDPVITVSALVDNQVSATASDDSGVVSSFDYQITPESVVCDDQLTVGFVSYNGQQINLSLDYKACFKATDAAGNQAYAGSAVGTATSNQVTVSNGSQPDSLRAVDQIDDNDDNWFRSLINPDSACDSTTIFAGAYTEGSDLDYSSFDHGLAVCFQANYPDGDAVAQSYGRSDVIGQITVTAGATATSFKAQDNLAESVDWGWIIADSCDASTDFGAVNAYTEGSDVNYALADAGQLLCFRAGPVDYWLYQSAAIKQATIAQLSADNGHYAAGQQVVIRLGLSEAVTVSGIPKLMLNNAAQASYQASASQPDSLAFVYLVASGDDIAQLDVVSIDLNAGSIVTSSSSLAISLDIPAGSNLADTSNLTIDTTAPEITVAGPDADNQVSASSLDNLSANVSLQIKLVDAGSDCPDQDFEDYPAASQVVLGSNQKACFKATDSAGNSQTAVSDPTAAIEDQPTVTTSPQAATNQISDLSQDEGLNLFFVGSLVAIILAVVFVVRSKKDQNRRRG